MAINDVHKARIIAHMNADHARELEEYLRAFNGVSASAARGAQLADMTLDSMTVTCASGTHAVSIVPPLGSVAEARVRLVDMSQRARQKLGLSAIRIATYAPPARWGILSFAGVSLYFVCAATLGLVQPGTRAWEVIDARFPAFPGGFGGGDDGGALTYVWLVKAIFAPVLAIHVTEAWWMARTRLARHSVDAGTALWWLWVADTFLEGYPAMMRFDGLVAAEEKRKQKESAKH
ncbi:hypothetical protein AAE478_006290 [Parahypoxylon ruwenzoriense]